MTAVAPVLVTGCPRTGTTWLGRMLTLSGELGELYEPFNPRAHQARWFDPPHHYLHVDDTNDGDVAGPVAEMADLRYPLRRRLAASRSRSDARRAVRTWSMVRRLRIEGRSPLIKDPTALFSTPWLHDRFGFRPVIVVRHPCGFVSSLLRVGWQVNFESFRRQPRLMSTLLAPWRPDIDAAAGRPRDPVADGALLWTLCTGVIESWRRDHPDWVVARHEDLAADPVPAFEALYHRLGLRWSDAVALEIEASSSAENPQEVQGQEQHQLSRDSRAVAALWRTRLPPEQVATVRRLTEAVASSFYDEGDW